MPLQKTEKVWHNGRFIEWDDATVHVFSHVVSYASALFEGTRCYALPGGPAIRLVTPACFLGTKLEAFEDRGRGDYLESHDLEDVLTVVDGRPEIVSEIMHADPDVRRYVRAVFARLLADEGFLNALPDLVMEGSPATRVPVVLQRLRSIAGIPKAGDSP